MTVPDYRAWLDRIKDGTASPEDYRGIFTIPHKRPLAALIIEDDASWLSESLADPQQPRTKRWIYVASAVLGADTAEDRSKATELLKKGALELKGTFFEELSPDLHQLLGEYHETDSSKA